MAAPHPLIFSRRWTLAALAVGVAPGVSPPPRPDAATLCAAWRATSDEIERLTARWQGLEAQAMRTGEEASAVLAQLDARLETLFARRAALLAAVLAAGPADARGVAGKLAVAARLLAPEDAPEAQALVAGALADLLALRCPGCGAAVAHWRGAGTSSGGGCHSLALG